MRGKDEQQLDVFSYVSPEQRVPQDHPLRSLRFMTDEAISYKTAPKENRSVRPSSSLARTCSGDM
jgi:hypothetical protein